MVPIVTLLRRSIVGFVLAIGWTLPAGAQAGDSAAVAARMPVDADSAYQPEELRSYLLGTFGPRPVILSAALAGFDQWRMRPSAFPQNGRGFADRLGSRYAQVVISHTLRFGIARTLDERTIRYQPCACGDSTSRFAHALIAPLRVSTPSGVRLSLMYPLTEIVSGILVTAARSDGLHVGDGIRNGLVSIAAASATSLVREFWPWQWRPPFL